MSLVSLVKIRSESEIKKGIAAAFDLIRYEWSKNIKNIVIKPNLCYYWDYTTGQTTDPKFVAALIDLIRERITQTVDISIVESDASAMKCKHAFKMLGYEKLAADRKVKLVNLSQDQYETVQVTAGKQSFNLMIPQTIRKAHLKINVPKIKYTMEKIKLTCALKNIYGCNPNPEKYHYHSILEEAIVAINKAMRFDLCIIDGNIVSGIQPRKLGLIMASQDPVAIDVAAGEIAGLNPKKIRYLQLAEREGLGKTSYISKGVPISYFKSRYPRKNFEKKLMNKAYDILVFTGLNRKLGI